MPGCPDHSADQADLGERRDLREFRDKEFAPSDLFSQSGTDALNDSHGRCEHQIKHQHAGGRHPAESETGDEPGDEIGVESALAGNPDCAVSNGGVCQWNDIAQHDIFALRPRPAERADVALEDAACEQGRCARAPHQSEDVAKAGGEVLAPDDECPENRADGEREYQVD